MSLNCGPFDICIQCLPEEERKEQGGTVHPHSPSIHAYKIGCVEQTNILKKKADKSKILFHSTRRKTSS